MSEAIFIAARKVVGDSLFLTDAKGEAYRFDRCEVTVRRGFELFSTLEHDPYIALIALRRIELKSNPSVKLPILAKRYSANLISLYVNMRAIGRLEYSDTLFNLRRIDYVTPCGYTFVEYSGHYTVKNNITGAVLEIPGDNLPKRLFHTSAPPVSELKWGHLTKGVIA